MAPHKKIHRTAKKAHAHAVKHAKKRPIIPIVIILACVIGIFLIMTAKPQAVVTGPECGDFLCEASESCSSCPGDCGECDKKTIKESVDLALPDSICTGLTDGQARAKAQQDEQLEYCLCIDDARTKEQCLDAVTNNVNYDKAVKTYDLGLCNNLTHVYAKQSCLDIVNSGYETISEQDPMYFIQLYTDANNYEDAVPLLEEIIADEPNNYLAVSTLARIYSEYAWEEFGSGTYTNKAIVLAEKAIELNPSSPMPYRIRGYLYEAMREYDNALTFFEKSLDKDPSYIPAYLDRAHTYRSMGNYAAAITDLNKAKDLDIQLVYVDIYAHLCVIESNVQELFDDAVENCLIVTNYDSDSIDTQKTEAYAVLGNLYRLSGRFEEAQYNLEAALLYSPEDIPTHVALAVLYNTLEDYTSAQDYAEKAIAIDETASMAYNELAYALYKQGQADTAIAAALDGLKAVEKDSSLLSLTKPIAERKLYYMLADIYAGIGDNANEQKYDALGKAATEEFESIASF